MGVKMETSMVDAANPISVLITTHDRPADLHRAIASVTSQTRLPAELVIVDDGSTPPISLAGLEIPQALSLRLVHNALPSNPARARNIGITATTRSWVAFLNNNNKFKPNKIKTL